MLLPPDDVELTHELPFQYWPEPHELPPEDATQLEPFQYWPDVHEGGAVTHAPLPSRYCPDGHPSPLAGWPDPEHPERGSVAQFLTMLPPGITYIVILPLNHALPIV